MFIYYDEIRYMFTQNEKRNHSKLDFFKLTNSTDITKSRNIIIFIHHCYSTMIHFLIVSLYNSFAMSFSREKREGEWSPSSTGGRKQIKAQSTAAPAGQFVSGGITCGVKAAAESEENVVEFPSSASWRMHVPGL